MAFQKATKAKAKLRMGLCGPSGSGKSYTALRIASGLGEKVAAIDTEHGSLSKYADEFNFDVMDLYSYHPQNFINGIKDAEEAGYDVLIIDSLSHAWIGKDGVIEQKEKAEARQRGGNSFTAWKDVTPLHNALVEAILQSKLHIIVTMRSKTEYIIEKNEKGQSVPKKVGMAPVQRDGMEYEFDIVADMDHDNTMIVSKSRCKTLSGAVVKCPGEETAQVIKDWLTDGVDLEERALLSAKTKWEVLAGSMDGFDQWYEEQKQKGFTIHQMETKLTQKLMEKKKAV